MRTDPLGTHEKWGRAIQRSASTVRKRLAALIERRILQGFSARPVAEVLGLQAVGATWDTAVDLDALFALEGTVMGGTTIDGKTHVGAYCDDPGAWLAAASDLAGRDPTMTIPGPPYTGPAMGPLELRVMTALVQAPRGSAEELAAICGLSAKTVRKRRDAIVAAGAVEIEPVVRIGRSGAIAYHVHVHCRREDAGAVFAALEETSRGYDGCPFLCVYARGDTVEELAQRLEDVRALGHDMEIIHEHELRYQNEALLAMIERALEAWQPSRGK